MIQPKSIVQLMVFGPDERRKCHHLSLLSENHIATTAVLLLPSNYRVLWLTSVPRHLAHYSSRLEEAGEGAFEHTVKIFASIHHVRTVAQ